MKRRVALADALMLRPRVLLLDDFLAGLDYSMRESAGAVLSEAAAFSSVIVTGHEIADMAKFVTRFLVIKDGVVAKSISLSEVGAEAAVAEVRKAMEGVGK
jgi:ABC-type multidrug transport system ATPase subunit